MRSHVRISILAIVVAALAVALAPAAADAAFGVERFFAGNCLESTCGKEAKPPSESEEETKGFRPAGGKVPFGVTDFRLNTFTGVGPLKATVPQGSVKELRVDVAPGVVTNPQAVAKCSQADFAAEPFEFAPGQFALTESTCPNSSIIGKNIVETVIEVAAGVFKNYTFEGLVYNLEQPVGLGSEFGVALNLEPLLGFPLYSHTLIEGNVEWASNYHDYFVIKGITPGLIESRLVFEGTKPTTLGFLRNPTACTKRGAETTTMLTATPYEGEGSTETRSYENQVGSTNCNLNFGPSFELKPETSASDQPDGVTAKLTTSHPANEAEPDTADLLTSKAVLPEGLTMNPAAAAGLAGCTRKQIGIETRNSEECPAASKIGTFELEVPTLPAHSLAGPIFLGKPDGKQ